VREIIGVLFGREEKKLDKRGQARYYSTIPRRARRNRRLGRPRFTKKFADQRRILKKPARPDDREDTKEMRHYEIVAIIHPDQSERVGAMSARYQEIVAGDGGKVHRAEDWGRRQLAYPLQKLFKAHYILLNVECARETLAKLRESFSFSDAVLRTLIVRKEREVAAASPVMAQKRRDDEGGE
jgi:small subunit ribosomal protein S6